MGQEMEIVGGDGGLGVRRALHLQILNDDSFELCNGGSNYGSGKLDESKLLIYY